MFRSSGLSPKWSRSCVIWAVVRLLGVELTVGKGPDPTQVGAVDVLLATLVAGLAAWGVHGLLARSPRTTRWWPFIGTTAIAISMTGPSYLADGAAVDLVGVLGRGVAAQPGQDATVGVDHPGGDLGPADVHPNGQPHRPRILHSTRLYSTYPSSAAVRGRRLGAARGRARRAC
jgi:Family of unknown function (DUF6069)